MYFSIDRRKATYNVLSASSRELAIHFQHFLVLTLHAQEVEIPLRIVELLSARSTMQTQNKAVWFDYDEALVRDKCDVGYAVS